MSQLDSLCSLYVVLRTRSGSGCEAGCDISNSAQLRTCGCIASPGHFLQHARLFCSSTVDTAALIHWEAKQQHRSLTEHVGSLGCCIAAMVLTAVDHCNGLCRTGTLRGEHRAACLERTSATPILPAVYTCAFPSFPTSMERLGFHAFCITKGCPHTPASAMAARLQLAGMTMGAVMQ